jgi:O-antigen ligase
MKKLAYPQAFFDDASSFFIILCCFFIPFSTSLMGAAGILAAACWVLSGRFFSLPRLMVNNKAVFLAIALFLLFVVGLLYTSAPMNDALAMLKKYRKIIFFAMVISCMSGRDRAAKLAEDSFILGCVILLLASYGVYFSLIPSERFGYSIVHHISHSYLMAILAFWCLQRAFGSRQYRYLWLIIFVMTSVNLLYIAPGRTGMLVYLALIALTILQHFSWKKSVLAALLASLAISVAFATSANFSSRLREAFVEIKSYEAESSRTSVGQRFDWWQNSIDLIKQKPLLGHGTGSFGAAQAELIKGSDTKPTDNPHNEYLMIGVQTGLIGLGLWLALLVAQFFTAFRLPPPKRFLLQGVVIAMACGCIMNSFLLDTHPGHFYAFISAILIAPLQKNGLRATLQT